MQNNRNLVDLTSSNNEGNATKTTFSTVTDTVDLTLEDEDADLTLEGEGVLSCRITDAIDLTFDTGMVIDKID